MSRVLVADDRPTNRQYLTTVLGYAGHRVLEAADGAEALALVQAERPDLVVTDLLMPGMDGVELVQRLRATPGLGDTPVIFYTATYREREARALAESCGVAHVLVKPVEPAAILAAVHAALGLPAQTGRPASLPEAWRPPVDRLAQALAEGGRAGEAGAGKLGALVRLGLALATEREPGRLAEVASRGARELTGARLAAAGCLADDGHGWAHFAATGPEGRTPAQVRAPSPDRDPLRQVLATLRPLRLRDVALPPESLGLDVDQPRVGAFLGVPVRSGAQPLGVLCVLGEAGGDGFGEPDEILLEALAAHLAEAVENARLYDEIQRHAAALRLEASARSQAEAALRRSEARFRSLVENAAEMITVLDADGEVRYASPAGERLLGHPPEDALGADGFAFVHPDDRPAARSAFAQALAHPGKTFSAELRVRHADGTWRVVESTGVNRLDDPAVGGVVINARDITARKAAEAERERLRARERKAAERLARLHAVTAALAPALSEAEVAGIAVEQGVAAAGASAGSISRLAEDGTSVEVVHAVGYPEAVLESYRRFPLAAPVPIADAARTGRPVWLESPEAIAESYPRMAQAQAVTGNRAAAAIPLAVEGRILGVLGLSYSAVHPFSPEERAHLLTLAQQCAQALERAQLYESERAARAAASAAARRATFLAEASATLASTLDLDAALNAVARLALPGMADMCTVRLTEAGELLRVGAIAHVDPAKERLVQQIALRYPTEGGAWYPSHEAHRTAWPVLIASVGDDALAAMAQDADHLGILRQLNLRSVLVVPLVRHGEVLGTLGLAITESDRRFGDEDLALAEEFARRVSAAVEIARQFQRAEAEIAERRRAQAAAEDLARFPLENPNPVLRAAADGTLLFANPASAPLLASWGCREGQALPDAPREIIRAVLEAESGREIEVTVGERVFSLLFSPLGEAGYVNLYGRDLTARKAAEARSAYQARLLANVNDAIVASDADYRLTAWNAAAEAMYGWTAEEVLGRAGLEVVRTEFVGVDKAEVFRALAETGRYFGEATQVRQDGTRFPVEVSSMVLRDEAGHVAGYVSVNRDITARKAAEAALHESEAIARQRLAELEAIYESAPVGLCVLDADLRYVRINQRLADINGIPAADHVGKTVRDIVPHLADQAEPAMRRVIDTGEPLLGIEIVGETAAQPGVQRHWVEHWLPLWNADGRVIGLNIVAEEVTARKAAEAERESLHRQAAAERARLEAVLQKMPAGVIIAEAPSGRILLANEQMASVWRRADTARFLEWPRFHRDGRPFDRAEIPLVRALSAGETVTDDEEEIERGDGTRGVVSVNSAPVRDDAGRVVAGVTVHLDITDRRRLDEELAKAVKLESIGVLAGGIAHDFNNLLTAVLANASLIRLVTEPGTKPYAWLAEVEKASRRAQDLTQRLLTFAKGGAPVRRPIALGDLAREYAGLALAGSSVRAEFDLPADLWPVEADPGQLGQVVQNLVLNARQALPAGGTLRVEAANVRLEAGTGLPLPAGGYVRLAVVDRGAGIPAEVLPRVLDPFFTTKPGGHGLGLAIAFSVVRQHGGHLTVESAVGTGTTVTAYLPAAGSAGAASTTTLDTGGVDSMGGSGRILLMDDEPAVRSVAGEVLAALGYEAVGAGDGAEAVELYRKALEAGAPFDLVILDLTVPGGLGGVEALQRLRAIDANVTAIVASGYANDPILTEHGRHGFRGGVVKPYTAGELSRAVRAGLADRRSRRDAMGPPSRRPAGDAGSE